MRVQDYARDPGKDESAEATTCSETVLEWDDATDSGNIPTAPPIIRTLPGIQTTKSRVGVWKKFSAVFVDLFLPIDYPRSVDESYLPYQLYDGLQGLCSYWRGVVATQAVLEAAGVGDAEATAASAALQWALRDGTGMIGGLVFSYMASHKFDIYVKEFRLFADIVNDVALTLDMVAPYLRSSHGRLWILSLSTIGKTLCGMSAGATKGRITQHFATKGNMADLTAKESTQETLVSLLGMIGGVAVAKFLQQFPVIITFALFGILTLVHVWANYKAVRLLRLRTLNPQRTEELLQPLLDVLSNKDIDVNAQRIQEALHAVATPDDINESLFASTKKLFSPTVHLNNTLVPSHFQFANVFANTKYLIGANADRLSVYLKVGATDKDQLQAFLHALLIQRIMGPTRKLVQPDGYLLQWYVTFTI